MERRFFSLLLAAFLLFTALPFTALAADGTVTEGYFTYSIVNGEATVTSNSDYLGGYITIPSATVDGYPVTAIGDQAFFFHQSLIEVTIPDGIVSIGDAAFTYCSRLERVVIPDSVVSIGATAFALCEMLTDVTVGSGVTSIGVNAFYNCPSLTAFEVSDRNTAYSVKDGVLFNKAGTELITCPTGKSGAYTLPDGVTAIGALAFTSCEDLTQVILPDSLTAVGDEAFTGCIGLTAVTLPENTDLIGCCAFSLCSGLKCVTVLNRNAAIDGSAFDDCTDLRILYGYAGSTAEAFAAAEEGMTFVDLARNGDLNGDEAIDVADLVRIKKYFADGAAAEIAEQYADVNRDGTVDADDLPALRGLLLGVL